MRFLIGTFSKDEVRTIQILVSHSRINYLQILVDNQSQKIIPVSNQKKNKYMAKKNKSAQVHAPITQVQFKYKKKFKHNSRNSKNFSMAGHPAFVHFYPLPFLLSLSKGKFKCRELVKNISRQLISVYSSSFRWTKTDTLKFFKCFEQFYFRK